MENVTEVIPINDIQEHTEDYSVFMNIPVSKCLCQPRTDLNIDSPGWTIVHSAWDGREAVEEFNAIVNPKN